MENRKKNSISILFITRIIENYFEETNVPSIRATIRRTARGVKGRRRVMCELCYLLPYWHFGPHVF